MDKICFLAVLLALATAFNAANGQMGTSPNMNCYTALAGAARTCTVSSSSCYGRWIGENLCQYWGPRFAADRLLNWINTPWFLFHSNYEAFPWYKVELSGAAGQVTQVRMLTRCDAHAWWHIQTIEIRHHTADIIAVAGVAATTGTVCNQLAHFWVNQCDLVAVTCRAPAAATTHVTIQQLTLDSHCWGSYWCNQHSHVNRYFLMAEEFYIDGIDGA